MNKDFEQQYEELSKTEPTRGQMMELNWALKELAEALSEHNVLGMFNHISSALRYISEFKGHFVKTPKLTEEEGNLACGLHTYMRKCMDSHLSVILYRMISEDRGTPIWYSFVKGLVANKNSYWEAIRCAEEQHELDKTTDNLIMLEALRMWEDENFKDAIKWIYDI